VTGPKGTDLRELKEGMANRRTKRRQKQEGPVDNLILFLSPVIFQRKGRQAVYCLHISNKKAHVYQ